MINLFINIFQHKDPTRQKELDYCFEKNQTNELIDKIIIVNRDTRATYGDFFQAMKDYPNDINIIANSDIYFDETIEKAHKIKEKQCYALTRWEDINGRVIDFNARHGKPSPPQWSQDAWIFRGSPNLIGFDYVIASTKHHTSQNIQFNLGIPGCDNKFAALLKGKGFRVTNPSLSIKAIHKHQTDKRDYPNFRILKGIKPHGLVYQEKI
jgi:hypothetical protein